MAGDAEAEREEESPGVLQVEPGQKGRRTLGARCSPG